MSEIIFPTPTHEGYEFVVGNVTYIWDGTKWVSDGPSAASGGATGPQGPDGATGPDGPQGATGSDGATGPEGGGPGAMCFTFRHNISTNTSINPGTGRISFNNSTPENATEIAISEYNSDFVDVANFLSLAGSGSKVYIQEERDSTSFMLLTLNAPGVDRGTFRTFSDITVELHGNVSFSMSTKIVVCAQPRGPIGLTGATGPRGLAGAGTSAMTFDWNSSLIPDTNAQYDLGSAEYKVRHLFLSDTSLYTDSGVLSVGLSTQVGLSSKVLMGNKLKEIVAASVDFLDFKAKMDAENFDNPKHYTGVAKRPFFYART